MTKDLGRISRIKRALDALRVIHDAINTLEQETETANLSLSDLYRESKLLLERLKKE